MAIAVPAAGVIAAKFIDTVAGQHRDSVQFQRQKELNKINNEFNAREAAKQRESATAQMRLQQQYNSEQAQVSRLKQAGLNPALLYGGATSSAGVSSTSAASASPSSYSMSGTQLDVAGALQESANIDLQLAQTENTRMNTASQSEDVFSKQVNNKYIDTKTNIELLKMLQEYENLKKVGALSDKDLQWYDATKASVLDQIRGQIDYWTKQGNLADANANYVSGVQTQNTLADTALKGSQKSLNIQKEETEKTIQSVNRENVISQQTRQALERMQTAVAEVTEKELQRKYKLDNDETNAFYKFCDKFGIPHGFVKGLLNLYGEFTKGTGKGLSEFFNGNNWFDFYNQMQNRENQKQMNDDRISSDEKQTDKKVAAENYRTDEWKPKQSNEVSFDSPLNAPRHAVKTYPSAKEFQAEMQRKFDIIKNDNLRREYERLIDRYKNYDIKTKQQIAKELYYANTQKEMYDIISKYLNKR